MGTKYFANDIRITYRIKVEYIKLPTFINRYKILKDLMSRKPFVSSNSIMLSKKVWGDFIKKTAPSFLG